MKSQNPRKHITDELGIAKNPQRETKDQNIPLSYRLILKLPNLSLEGFSDKFQGYFWMLIAPLFAFFNGCIDVLLLVELPFPVNMTAMLLYSATVAALFIRIHIQRELTTREAILGQGGFHWNVSKAFAEYIDILEKSQHKSQSAEGDS